MCGVVNKIYGQSSVILFCPFFYRNINIIILSTSLVVRKIVSLYCSVLTPFVHHFCVKLREDIT
uniref:Uncharacterized protein n=1 Tax=Siphoviridae sp. ctDXu9 TaxID=2825387 RepID=A0A8S5VDA4_9CAUD|nr:MAG TPA: hypothetical protein [Siphoviridae sp. ctDXu9]